MNKVSNINPIAVDESMTVILLLNANNKRPFVYLYFSEILSSK